MSVAAGLEYMFGKVQHTPHSHDDDEEEDGSEDADGFDSEEEKAARAREEAGADYRESIGHSSTSRDGSVIHSLHEPTYIREPGRPASSMASTFWAAVTPEPQ